MNTRGKILNAITVNKPVASPHPENLILPEMEKPEMVEHFIQMLGSIGGKVVEAESLDSVKKDLELCLSKGEYAVNTIKELGIVHPGIGISNDAISLAKVDRAFLKSELGVAENGAVWLSESDMINRLLPFICQHLVVVLEAKNIVANMHEAYKKLAGFDGGYGVFIAGPSKTADIEQSLVIGAHGARSLLIYLISR